MKSNLAQGDNSPNLRAMDSMVNPRPDLRFGNETKSEKQKRREAVKKWKAVVAPFQSPNQKNANWQIINTIGGLITLWFLMAWTVTISWWLTVPLAILAGGFLVRAFIIFHDCGHGSFYKSRKANNFWGYITGVLTFTPYQLWTWEHSIHHQHSGDLEHRGIGDVWTMTVKEYQESSRWRKFFYRLLRSPVVMFFFAPIFLFVFWQRFNNPKASSDKRISVWCTNLGLVAMSWGLIQIFGFIPWLIIQSIAITVAACSGVWLFYVQHQFEDTYWATGDDWDYTTAALQGSSFYKLPKILQWFSGNIGFHHVHHLSPKIPNYHLEACHKSDPMFANAPTLTLRESLKSISCHLWDEENKKLISFRKLKRRSLEKTATPFIAEVPKTWPEVIVE
jgi:acyl-lipid omega-6 desaturase (Delta-12 desaturase)